MDRSRTEMESVTVEFDEDTIEAVDEKAFADHRDNRQAAIRDLLDAWIKRSDVEDRTE